VTANSYQRNGVEITQESAKNWLVARITPDSVKNLRGIADQIRSLFDLRANTYEITAHWGKTSAFKKVVKQHPGLRVPGCWDGFELAVRAMLGQQVTVKGATTLTGRLVERFGSPKAEELAEANLSVIGIPKARAESIRGFARAVADGKIRFDGAISSEEMIGRMCELQGIGPWTANYIAMRALGDPDAFPASDLGLLKAAGLTSQRKLAETAEAWRPWRSYAAMYLWQTLRKE
jgi:3-methyladenine DNA glycosylase/8-oxoguanine DNA glycosylase